MNERTQNLIAGLAFLIFIILPPIVLLIGFNTANFSENLRTILTVYVFVEIMMLFVVSPERPDIRIILGY